jgi:hypothetical protein
MSFELCNPYPPETLSTQPFLNAEEHECLI